MNSIIKKIAFLFMTAVVCLQSWAQEKVIDVNISTESKSPDWYMQPWAWVAGGAVFILLFAAIIRGNKKA